MAIGKYLSLEEARKKGKLDRFSKEHPSVADGRFWQILNAIATGSSTKHGTSARVCPDSCSETQTLSDTSEDDA